MKKVSFEKEEYKAFNKQIEQMVSKDTNLLYFLKKIEHKYTMEKIYWKVKEQCHKASEYRA